MMDDSQPSSSELELELAAEPPSVTRARHAVVALARRLGAPAEDVALAVSEAVGNVVLHAYRDRPAGTVTVSAGLRDGVFAVVVSDRGAGMAPDLESPGLGVGISLIAQVAGDVNFNSTDTGTTVSMSFELDHARGPRTEAGARR